MPAARRKASALAAGHMLCNPEVSPVHLWEVSQSADRPLELEAIFKKLLAMAFFQMFLLM